MNPELQEIQEVVDPEQFAQGCTQLLQEPEIRAYPAGHPEVQDPPESRYPPMQAVHVV
jgi:hypothetical protein